MKLTNNAYDKIKWVAQFLLPALGTLYFALAGIWGFPYGEQIVGTITAIDTFLGVLLGISTSSYRQSEDVGLLKIDKHDSEQTLYQIYVPESRKDDLKNGDTFTVIVDDKADLSDEFAKWSN